MPQRLTLSRAARLAGVTRSELQQKLRDTGTETFEGAITVSDLAALYPDLDFTYDPVFERVNRIKREAKPKRDYSDGWVADAEVLTTRLKEMNRVLVQTRAALYRHEALLRDIQERLDKATADPVNRDDPFVTELQHWLTSHLQAPAPEHDARAELFARDALDRVLAPSVRILSTGHEFYVEGDDSILEAALKAGLHLEYGCSKGNCGACKARLVSGKAKEVRPHDYVLSPRERENGYILACSWTAVTDVLLEASEARRPQDLPHQEIRAAVGRIEHLSDDLALLHLKTPRTQTLRFMAGQSVLLTDEDGNSAHYPLASCPCDGRHLQFFIRRRDDQPFSAGVMDDSLKSQIVTLKGPEGDFVLQEESSAPAFFIAIGDGFAPVKSLVEQAISIDNAERIRLYVEGWPNLVPQARNLCRSWNDALDNFEFIVLPTGTRTHALAGRIQQDQPILDGLEIYIAGPQESVTALADALLGQKGGDSANIHTLIVG